MNYIQVKKIFETSRKRKLANNTYLEKNTDGSYAIRLHQTQIIKFYPEKTVLYSGGYRTVTTKARINEFAYIGKWYLYQKAGIWYLATGPNIGNTFVSSFVFADGITFHHKTDKWTNAGPQVEKTLKLRTQAKQYAKDFVVALFAGKVPEPGPGDCFYCSMVVQSPDKDAGRTLGEATQDNSHIINHIKEKYYVPSLVVNACKMFSVSKAAWWSMQELWEKGKASSYFADVGKIQIESAIRRYCYRQLQTA